METQCSCVCASFLGGGGVFHRDTQEGIPRIALLITFGDHRSGTTACNTVLGKKCF